MTTRDQRVTNAGYYLRNRQFESKRVRIRQNATRDYLRELRSVPCLDCGRVFAAHQMDFDHRDPASKSFRLTSGTAMLASATSLQAEIDKCDVVCANCRRVRTHDQTRTAARIGASPELERRREYWRSQARMPERLKRRPCADCGDRFPSCAMDFDHRDPGQKRCTVSRMISRAGTARIMAEVAKCDIVCANCHRDRTYRRREAGSSERE